MSFHRTPTGLSNLRYFLKVDGVLYVEGGQSYTFEEILEGRYSAESPDIHFWRTVFRECGSSLNLAFRSVGSKQTLQAIGRLVARGSVEGTLVAMDRDYDHIFGRKISCTRVLYTHGYSWESDVWTPKVVSELFYSVTGSNLAAARVDAELSAMYERFHRDMKHAIRADIICNAHSIEFLPKSKPRRLLRTTSTGGPVVDRKEIKACFVSAKKQRSQKLLFGVPKCDPTSDCHGHLAAEFGYLVLQHLVRKYSNGVSMPKPLVNQWAIDKFAGVLRANHNPALAKHYKGEVRPRRKTLR
ncbi:MAG: hypothetical protein ABFD86_05540 [Bryobacteraceae bacterium]